MMKTNTKIVLGVVGILLIILSVLFSGQFSLDGAGGATIFSIDTAQITGKGETGTEWIISLSMNDGAEKVTGEITPEIISKFNLAAVPEKSFTIDFELDNVQCNYEVESTDMVVGQIYNAQVDEQCLGIECPYDYVDLDDVIRLCQKDGGEDCSRMVELSTLGFGTHTEWCSWMPEESNTVKPGECQNIAGGEHIACRFHSPYPEGCGVCRGSECKSDIRVNLPERWASDADLCCFETVDTTGVGVDNGDWNVQSMGIVPKYQVQEIQTTPLISYDGTIVATFEDGTEFTAKIDEKTNIAELGELGNVKWVGNLIGNQFCPQPSINTGLLKDASTGEYKTVKAGAGSNYQSYLDTLNELTRTDADHYTFTLVTQRTVTAVDPAVGGDIIYTSYTKLNSLYKDLVKENVDDECRYDSNSNIFVCDTSSPVVLPLLKLTIKSSEVGIFIPDGQPEIKGVGLDKASAISGGDISETSFDSNKLNTVFVAIENIGSEDDSFDVSLNCPFPISQQSQRVVIDSGDIGYAELTLTGDGLIQECDVDANSVSYPSNRDTYAINVIINPSCDQLGITGVDMIFTEYGCVAQTAYKECADDEFWLPALQRCISETDINTGEKRIELLEEVAEKDCSLQCGGNKECIVSCLKLGNVRPICTGIGKMMSMNDYICDYENQQKLDLPTTLNNQIWYDASICNYVCRWGYEGANCKPVEDSIKFDYTNTPTTATLEKTSAECETCFDGVQNQDEEGIDCGGVCEEEYGQDKNCDKLRAPEHCYNNKEDGDEEGIDCGGSCDFSCDDVWSPEDTIAQKNMSILALVILLAGVMIAGIIYFMQKKGK